MFKKIAMMLALVLCISTPVYADSYNTITKYQHLRNGVSLADAAFEIIPYNEVETGSSILITFSNATVFSQEVIDGASSASGEIGYKPGGYQYEEDGVRWDGNESFYSFMPKVNGSEVPYHIRRISDIQIEVDLINVPAAYADGSLSSINKSPRAPYYRIPMVAYTDIERGDGEVGAYIDGNGTSISDMGDTKVNGSAAESTTTSDNSTESTTAQTQTTEGSEEETSNNTTLKNKVEVTIGSYTITVNDKKIALDVPAYIQGAGSTMLPLRAVSQGVVGNEDCVSWDAVTKTATITYGQNSVSFSAGSDKAVINGKSVAMANGAKAEIKESRMFVPFRALGEALGAKVDWIPETKTAVFN